MPWCEDEILSIDTLPENSKPPTELSINSLKIVLKLPMTLDF